MAFKDERAPMLAQKTFVQQEMLAEGVLWGGFHNVSYSHGDVEVGKILSAYERVLAKLAKALEAGTVESQLRGKQLEPVFRRTENFNMKPKAKTEGPAPREATR
jgi:hypothetical protein